jgi:hypothetical protein
MGFWVEPRQLAPLQERSINGRFWQGYAGAANGENEPELAVDI